MGVRPHPRSTPSRRERPGLTSATFRFSLAGWDAGWRGTPAARLLLVAILGLLAEDSRLRATEGTRGCPRARGWAPSLSLTWRRREAALGCDSNSASSQLNLSEQVSAPL